MIISKAKTPTTTIAFDTYWRFAKARQDVFFARLDGSSGPWTDDPIISQFKFTNTYRASDRVSQYLIKQVIYQGKWGYEDTFFRILLFKLFNKIETWQMLEQHFGEVSLATFDVDTFDNVLDKAISSGTRIYSAAYIMPCGSRKKYGPMRKHRFHLQLLQKLLDDHFHHALIDCPTMQSAYGMLLSIDSIGKFLAYQLITDLNYAQYFDYQESEFVVPGPGALDGIAKCFANLGDYTPADTIKWMMEQQQHHFDRLELDFKSLWGRPLQLIDCQNIFCEVDKYSRVHHPDLNGLSGRTRIKQKFKANSGQISQFYPPKWGINELLSSRPAEFGRTSL